MIDLATAQISDGLTALAKLGHHFHLVEGAPEISLPWPRMFYHEDCRAGVLVYGPEFLADLGPGWFDTIAEARQSAGLDTQFMGRGGVHRQGLPASIANAKVAALARPLTKAERIEAARLALEAEVNKYGAANAQ